MLSAGGEVIVLTVHRKSARAINTALHPGRAFSSGDPVMFTINDTELGLSNGSLGRISEVSADAVHVKWDDGREIPIADWRMLYLHLAYAVTVTRIWKCSWSRSREQDARAHFHRQAQRRAG
jgi:hypothetical protein